MGFRVVCLFFFQQFFHLVGKFAVSLFSRLLTRKPANKPFWTMPNNVMRPSKVLRFN